MRVPVLTYPSMSPMGHDYAANHLRAFASDLRTVTEEGFRIIPLRDAVDCWLRGDHESLHGTVALCVEDGSDFDFADIDHPTAGPQRSILNAMRDFQAESPGSQPGLHATSFVVVSPEARAALDRVCMVGKGWWNDTWWREALATGLMHIGNHSWDHHHEGLPEGFGLPVPRGTFRGIDNGERADHEIRQAAEFLQCHADNPGAGLFAYPYGQSNPYLSNVYLPRQAGVLGLVAAFTDRAGFLEDGVDRWELPRLKFGRDWHSPEGLRELLHRARTDPGPAFVEGRVAIEDPEDVKRYEMVPAVLADWMTPYGGLEGRDVLDFGCGQGVSAMAVATRYKARRVVGVDIGPDPARAPRFARTQLGLRQLPPNLELHRVAPGLLHDDADRFDLIYSWSVFEHVDQRLMEPVLEALRRSLKPTGFLFIQIAPLYYSAEGSHLFHKLAEPWGHLLAQHDVMRDQLRAVVPDEHELALHWGTYETLNRITAPELTRRLRKCGFDIVRSVTMKDERNPPPALAEVFTDEVLRTFQVVLLAKPA